MPTLRRQLEEINNLFDKQESELKQMRKNAINSAWNQHIDSGLLKSELS